MILIVAAVFLVIRFGGGYALTLRDGDTGEVYARYPVREGDQFSIGFIHSVNKSPLIDIYQIHDHKIYVEETVYYNFGAGVQTQLEEGQKLRYEDGAMIVSGFHQEMPDLSYIVGTVSDHILTIHDQRVSLRELCGRNSTVAFSCERRFPLERP